MINRVTIVGIGKVGGALAARLSSVGVDVVTVKRAEFLAWIQGSVPIGDVLVIAVKDQDVRTVATSIAEANTANRRLQDVVVLHVNGSQRLDVLASCEAAGASIAAAHPFQTFADADPEVLDGIGWGVESSDDVWPVVAEFVELTGGVAQRLYLDSADAKRIYHTAAVAASNYTYAAYELGRRLAQHAGISVEQFLLPIIEQTHDNAAEAIRNNTTLPLTGPIQRGDVEGVQRQLAAIPAHVKQVYIHLSLALLHLNRINMQPESFAAMRMMLSDAIE